MNEVKRDWRGISGYIIAAFAITWTVLIGLRALGVGLEVRATLGMFGPALASVIVRLAGSEGFRDSGLHLPRPGTRHLFLAAYAIPFGALAAAAILSSVFGLQVWDMSAGVAAAWSAWKFALALGAVLTIVVGLTMISAFGEELGWRGYLLPRLLPLGPLRASIIIGLIWGVWHAPLIVLDGRGFGKGHELIGLLMFVMLSTSWSIYLTWLCIRSDSIWPAVLSHATLNVVTSTIFAVFDPKDLIFGSPIGVLTVLCFLAVDAWLIATGRLNVPSNNP
ncbi:MAG: CPBP family intramembrane metalloprotease [Candidatus Hydrogenedentes bacterium]|nr:CPBP family intramembrane metalloprotease [Candidatus Hydrogenedentota bacterium]